MSDVFVSYKRENSAAVRRLVDALRADGLNVWWDADIPPHAPWEETIERNLTGAKTVIVAWSRAAISSDNVKAEARWARRNDRLLQVFVETCEPPLFFGERQGVDLTTWSGASLDPAFQALLRAVRERLNRTPGPADDGLDPPLVHKNDVETSNRTGPIPPGHADEARGLLPPGAVLNGLFEVKRLMGRGYIGEVYEGASVATRERVAIKTIFPKITERPGVQEILLREMRVLTRLGHPAINSYRMAAREPTYGVLYIIFEFVDGIVLDTLIGQVTVPEAKLRAVIRRLAEGLKYAHDMGAVHRDISPGNIVAPSGRLDACTIIDFGFSESLETMRPTLMVDERTRRPYAAPEQFGEFGGRIGPWTDVYSLALVMLALATGVQATNAAPDLSPLSRRLKPLLAGMLAADPEVRFRDMGSVLLALGDQHGRGKGNGPKSPSDGVPSV
jgi:tRNA A-37 threonylcarbamoyl transferase component Bud32